MKIEQALVLYLFKQKQLSLQGIGTFKLEGAIPDTTDTDKPVVIPAESIFFIYDPKTGEDENLINFIVQNTKKIKPLASADLDSFLTFGKQLLNIGKPFTIQNLGTIDKLSSGELEFRAGPLIHKIELPKPKIEDEGAEKHEENLFNDYQREAPGNNRKTILLILIIIVLIAGGWAIWNFGFKNNNEKSPVTNAPEKIVPIADTEKAIKVDSGKLVQKPADSINNIIKNPADSFTFKVVVKETKSKIVADAYLQHLKSYGRNVIMYTTDDSVTFKIAHPFMLPLSDTSKVLDSLNKYYYLGKAHIETK